MEPLQMLKELIADVEEYSLSDKTVKITAYDSKKTTKDEQSNQSNYEYIQKMGEFIDEHIINQCLDDERIYQGDEDANYHAHDDLYFMTQIWF